jgi:hypothetical protein
VSSANEAPGNWASGNPILLGWDLVLVRFYNLFLFRSLVTYALALQHELSETLAKSQKSKKGFQKREALEEEKPEPGNHSSQHVEVCLHIDSYQKT